MARKTNPASVTEKGAFPTRLRTLMKERKVTQKELADAVDMRPQTISLYTQGQSAPDINCLKKMAEYFSVSADWLLGLSEERSTDEDIKRICKATRLDEDLVEYFVKAKQGKVGMFFGSSDYPIGKYAKEDLEASAFDAAYYFNIFFTPKTLHKFLNTIGTYVMAHDRVQEICSILKSIKDKGRQDEFVGHLEEYALYSHYFRFVAIDTMTKIFDEFAEQEKLESQINDALKEL